MTENFEEYFNRKYGKEKKEKDLLSTFYNSSGARKFLRHLIKAAESDGKVGQMYLDNLRNALAPMEQDDANRIIKDLERHISAGKYTVVVLESFVFEKTPEGYNFWVEVCNQLERILRGRAEYAKRNGNH